MATLDDLEKLEHLSLVSRIVTEMENHFGIGEKEVAEFVIDTAKRSKTFDVFKKALHEQGLDEGVSLFTSRRDPGGFETMGYFPIIVASGILPGNCPAAWVAKSSSAQ